MARSSGFIRAAEGDYQRRLPSLSGRHAVGQKKRGTSLPYSKSFLTGGGGRPEQIKQKTRRRSGTTLCPRIWKNVGWPNMGPNSLDILLRRVYPKGASPDLGSFLWNPAGHPDAAEQIGLTWSKEFGPKSDSGDRLLSVPAFSMDLHPPSHPAPSGGFLASHPRLSRVLRPFCLRLIKDLSEAEVAWVTRPFIFLDLRSPDPHHYPAYRLFILSRMFWKNVGTVLLSWALTWFLLRRDECHKRADCSPHAASRSA